MCGAWVSLVYPGSNIRNEIIYTMNYPTSGKVGGTLLDRRSGGQGTSVRFPHPVLCLTLLMLVTSLIVFWKYLFWGQLFIFSDIGSDTKDVYYPFFTSLLCKLQEGDLTLWDFSYGLGTNAITRQADVGSVFTWILLFFWRDSFKYGLVYVHILKLFLAGYACYGYLGCFRTSRSSRVIVAYVYAFNGFSILWGQHYFFGTASLVLICLLWAIEKSFTDYKGYFFTAIAVFFVGCNSFYFAYMVLLFAGVYAVVRLCYRYDRSHFVDIVKHLLLLLAAVITGMLLASFLFVPAVSMLLSTSNRVSGEGLLSRLAGCIALDYPTDITQAIFSRFHSNNLMGTWDYIGPCNYYEISQWFFTSLTFFMAAVYVSELFFRKDMSRKQKVLAGLGVAVVVYAAFWPLLSFVFNGFVTPFYRHTFLFMPLMALCFTDVIDLIFHRKLSHGRIQIALAGVFAMAVFLITMSKTGTVIRFVDAAYLLAIVGFAVVSFHMYVGGVSTLKHVLCLSMAIVIVFCNVTLDSYITNNRRVLTSETQPQIYLHQANDTVEEFVRQIKAQDDSFYRIDKTFVDLCTFNDAMLQDYYSVSTYNSVLNQNQIHFGEVFCPEFEYADLPGYFTFQNIYRNVDIASVLGVKYIISNQDLSDVPEYQLMDTVNGISVYRNTATEGIGKFYTNAMDYEDCMELPVEERAAMLDDTLVITGLEEPSKESATEAVSAVTFQTPVHNDRVYGAVSTDQDGWVYMAIPYENGWTAYVDGEEVEILQANVGCSAVAVSAGDHEIELRYHTPMMKQGVILSCVGLVIFTTWVVVFVVLEKKKKCHD